MKKKRVETFRNIRYVQRPTYNIYIQKHRASCTTRLARSRSPINTYVVTLISGFQGHPTLYWSLLLFLYETGDTNEYGSVNVSNDYLSLLGLQVSMDLMTTSLSSLKSIWLEILSCFREEPLQQLPQDQGHSQFKAWMNWERRF